MEKKEAIISGKTALGIELGSTRIKGGLIFRDKSWQWGSMTGKIPW